MKDRLELSKKFANTIFLREKSSSKGVNATIHKSLQHFRGTVIASEMVILHALFCRSKPFTNRDVEMKNEEAV